MHGIISGFKLMQERGSPLNKKPSEASVENNLKLDENQGMYFIHMARFGMYLSSVNQENEYF